MRKAEFQLRVGEETSGTHVPAHSEDIVLFTRSCECSFVDIAARVEAFRGGVAIRVPHERGIDGEVGTGWDWSAVWEGEVAEGFALDADWETY